MKNHTYATLILAVTFTLAGCASLTPERQASIEKMLAAGLDVATSALDDYYARKAAQASNETAVVVVPTPDIPPIAPPAEGAAVDEIDLAIVAWDGPNVAAWPITSRLAFSMNGRKMDLRYDKVKAWPGNGDGLNANPWIIANINGQWRAATFEWMRYGQCNKNMSGIVLGSVVKRDSWGRDWEPKSGETVYMMVSGLARGGQHNVSERTQAEAFVWP